MSIEPLRVKQSIIALPFSQPHNFGEHCYFLDSLDDYYCLGLFGLCEVHHRSTTATSRDVIPLPGAVDEEITLKDSNASVFSVSWAIKVTQNYFKKDHIRGFHCPCWTKWGLPL